MLMHLRIVRIIVLLALFMMSYALLMSCGSTRRFQSSSMNFHRDLALDIADTLFLPLTPWNGFNIPYVNDNPEDMGSLNHVPQHRSVPGSSVSPYMPIIRHTTINTHDRQSAQTTDTSEVQRNLRTSMRHSSYYLVVFIVLVLVIAIVYGLSSRKRR